MPQPPKLTSPEDSLIRQATPNENIFVQYRAVVIRSTGRFQAIFLENKMDFVQGDTMYEVFEKLSKAIDIGKATSDLAVKEAINLIDNISHSEIVRFLLLNRNRHFEVRCLDKNIYAKSDISLSDALRNCGIMCDHIYVFAKKYFDTLGKSPAFYQNLWGVGSIQPKETNMHLDPGEPLIMH